MNIWTVTPPFCKHFRPKMIRETTCRDADQPETDKPRKYLMVEHSCPTCYPKQIQLYPMENR